MQYDLDPALEAFLEKAIRAQFGNGAVSDIVIEVREDQDGETVINVKVVLDERPEPRTLRTLVRGLLPSISQLNVGFPVFSFATRNALVGAAA